MTGYVFHPGHEALHGVTVIVEARSGQAWVGRYHERTERGVLLHDVAIHDPSSATLPREGWLEQLRKFGVRVEARHIVVPTSEVDRIRPLVEHDGPT
jgi:hypothetical protein